MPSGRPKSTQKEKRSSSVAILSDQEDYILYAVWQGLIACLCGIEQRGSTQYSKGFSRCWPLIHNVYRRCREGNINLENERTQNRHDFSPKSSLKTQERYLIHTEGKNKSSAKVLYSATIRDNIDKDTRQTDARERLEKLWP